MLAEYFSLNISESGLVLSLPVLLRDFIPNLDFLPMFLMRLGPQVRHQKSFSCFTVRLIDDDKLRLIGCPRWSVLTPFFVNSRISTA